MPVSRRVLHVVRTDGVSGAENHLAALAAHLPALGWNADFLIASRFPDRLEGFALDLRSRGCAVRVEPMRGDVNPRLLRAIRRALVRGDHDLVHTHLVHADWHAGLASLGLRSPSLVSTKHNHDPFRARQPFRAVEAAWMRRNAATIAISASLSDFVEANNGTRPVTVLYGWPADPSVVPREPVPPGRLLAVGRLEPQKGFDVLLDAIAILAAQDVDVRLDIAGEGSLRGALEAQIATAGLQDRVQLLGQRSDVPDLMRAAYLFVHSARWEGFGLVLLEAMSAALPIVATAVGAIPEVVADGETGLLVAPDDAAAFAGAIAQLVLDPERAARISAAGLERLRSRFAPELMARRTVDVYERALIRRA